MERRMIRSAAELRKPAQIGGIGRRNRIEPRKLRVRLEQGRAQLRQRVVREPASESIRQRPQYRPVFARVSGRETGPIEQLNATFGVDG